MSSHPDTTDTSSTTEQTKSTASHHAESEQNRWVARFEDLLKVKNVEDLKSELGKLASEIQTEIQKFDINVHLSPEAKSRLKILEKNYNDVIKAVHKAQKQFDREFNKSLRVLKRTRQDAEKHLKNIKTKITKHRGTIVKASNGLKSKIKKTAKSATKKSKSSTRGTRKAKSAKKSSTK